MITVSISLISLHCIGKIAIWIINCNSIYKFNSFHLTRFVGNNIIW